MSEQVDYETRLKVMENKYDALLSRVELLQRRLSDAENCLVQSGLRGKHLSSEFGKSAFD